MIRLVEIQRRLVRRVIFGPTLCIGRKSSANPEEPSHRPNFEGAGRQVYRNIHDNRKGWQYSLRAESPPRVDETYTCFACRAMLELVLCPVYSRSRSCLTDVVLEAARRLFMETSRLGAKSTWIKTNCPVQDEYRWTTHIREYKKIMGLGLVGEGQCAKLDASYIWASGEASKTRARFSIFRTAQLSPRHYI